MPQIERLLGKRLFSNEQLLMKPQVGVVTGLAWTSLGGDTLFIEASAVPSKSPAFKQTGQLGAVMVESSQIRF